MSRTQFRHIRDDVYKIDLLVVWGGSIDHAQEIAEELFDIKNELAVLPSDAGAMFECETNKVCCLYVIWMERRELSTVAHECLHVTADVFKKRGVLFNISNDEQIAYYMGYLIDAIMSPKKRKKHA
jgi:hypothetical protein